MRATDQRRDRRAAAALVCVLAVAVALRVAAAVVIGDVAQPRGDERYYVMAALDLARGAGYPGTVRPPGFPAFMALVFVALGESLSAVRLAQVAVSVLAVALVFALVRARFGVRAAFLSALFCAVQPDLVHYPHFLWAETLVATIALLVVWMLDRFDRSGRERWLVASGIALGCGALTRETLLYFVPLVLVWVAARDRLEVRRVARRALLLLLPVAATILPWTARNYAVQGRLVLIATTRWLPIAQGNLLPAADAPFDLREAVRFGRAYSRIEDEAAREEMARETALRAIRDAQPWWILRKLERNSYFLFAPRDQVERFAERGWFGGRAQPLVDALVPIEACVYVALTALGLCALWLVPGGRVKQLAVAFVLLHLAIYTVANANHRFRVPLEPFLLLYAGPLLLGAAVPFARARLRWLGAALTLAAFLAVVAVDVVREGGLGVKRIERRAPRGERPAPDASPRNP